MDAIDRVIINRLQGEFPLCERPYAAVAGRLGISETELISRLQALLDDGTLSRFGPMYHAEQLGGAAVLAAMRIPAEELERVAEQVNAYPEVAHNYAREHEFNMWFVLASDAAVSVDRVTREITATTGYPVYVMPKLEEYFVEAKFTV